MERNNPTPVVRTATAVVRFPVQERFDPAREFSVARRFKLSGVEQVPPQPFDKGLTSTRRLKQLYEQRLLKMLPRAEVQQPAPEPVRPVFTELSSEALRDWLRAINAPPRSGISRARLIELCNEAYDKQQAEQQQVA